MVNSWVITQRVKRGNKWVFERHIDSPIFMNVGLALEWARDKGLVTRDADDSGEHYYKGWGDPWYACLTTKAVEPL